MRSVSVSELGQKGVFLLLGEVNKAKGSPGQAGSSDLEPGAWAEVPTETGTEPGSISLRSPEVYISEMAPRLVRKTFPGL